MPDSNVGDEDKDGVKGGEEPIDSPQRQPEEPVDGGGGADHELTLVYEGKVYCVSLDKAQFVLSMLRNIVPSGALSMLGNMVPSGNLDAGSDPVNQQGTHEGLPVQEQKKESFREEAALGMQQRKKGKFADDGEGSSSVSAQTSCMECGISSKSTMMRSGVRWDSKENLTIRDIQEPSAKETEQSDEEAKESDASKNVGGK